MSYIIQTPACTLCKQTSTIDLTPEEQQAYEKWQNGELRLVQDAFPQWDDDKRELLISGTHPKCWNEIFLDEDEEDDWEREDEDE